MINNSIQLSEKETILFKQIKYRFSKSKDNPIVTSLGMIIECFKYLAQEITSQGEDPKKDLRYDDILSYLRIIFHQLSFLPDDTNFHGIDFFQVLIELYSLISDDQTQIKINIFYIIEFMVRSSDDGSRDFIECDANKFLKQIFTESENTSIKTHALYLMKNIMTGKEDDLISQYYIENNFIEMLHLQYESLISNPELDIDKSISSQLIPTASFLINFIFFPKSIPSDTYYKLFETINEIFENRRRYIILNDIIDDALSYLLSNFREIDLSIFIKTRLIYKIYDIINEENPISSHCSQSFFLLGGLAAEDSEIAKDIISNSNFISICSKKIEENDKGDETLQSFFFFLTNILHLNENFIIESLIEIDLFSWCIAICNDICFNAQKSLCYFFLATLFFAPDNVIFDLLSEKELIDFIFEVISVSKKKLIIRALNCFVKILKKISITSTKFSYLSSRILIFLDSYNTKDISDEDDKERIDDLLETIHNEIINEQ